MFQTPNHAFASRAPRPLRTFRGAARIALLAAAILPSSGCAGWWDWPSQGGGGYAEMAAIALMAIAFASNAALAAGSWAWGALFAAQCVFYAAGLIGARSQRAPPLARSIGYFVSGHAAGLAGLIRYACGLERGQWKRAGADMQTEMPEKENFIHLMALAGKRAVDILCASIALLFMGILFIPIAVAIKVTSRGPIFYRQIRVGRRTPTETHLFYLTKFRTKRVDAEAKTGAVWAQANDPRITRVGNFLRKTRLDELPQCINVLKGEMSVVGPRPERPQFFQKLETAIPYYTERTYGLKPGITGLSQVSQGYDTSIEDVRFKVMFDHVYALRISRPFAWLKVDLSIIASTFFVMVLGKGQ